MSEGKNGEETLGSEHQTHARSSHAEREKEA